jgi:hypothetical protein
MKNIDFINLDQSGEVEVLPNGFISITANLTRTGIFTYRHMRPDGTVKLLKQLRIEEEVFSEEAIASLSGLPITNNHPSVLVSPENASEYIVGMSSDNPKRIKLDSEDYVQQKLVIFDDSAISMIKNKEKCEMSLGYQCTLDMTPGEYKGEAYDCVQRDIRYNHGSIVKEARGGPNCRILLDGAKEVVLDGFSDDECNNNKSSEVLNVKKFIFDGKEYQVEDSVHALLTGFVTQIDEAKDLVRTEKAELEKKTAICDDMESQIKVLKDKAEDKEAFSAAVKARVDLESKGRKVLGEDVVLDGLTDLEIKKKVVEKVRPNTNLDDKSEDYIGARFEVALEDSKEGSNTNSDEDELGKHINNKDSKDSAPDAEKARIAAWNRDANLWKGDK